MCLTQFGEIVMIILNRGILLLNRINMQCCSVYFHAFFPYRSEKQFFSTKFDSNRYGLNYHSISQIDLCPVPIILDQYEIHNRDNRCLRNYLHFFSKFSNNSFAIEFLQIRQSLCGLSSPGRFFISFENGIAQ